MKPRRLQRTLAELLLGLTFVLAGVIPAAARRPLSLIRVTVTVVNDEGKPIRNAGVVIRQLVDARNHKPRHGGLHVELKSDDKGTVSIEGFEPGIVLVQVIADGYKTFGGDFQLRRPQELVKVTVMPPKPQISIYH